MPSRSISDTAAHWVARRDAGLSRTEQAELAAWLAADQRHQSAWQRYDSAWSTLDRPANRGTADLVLENLAHLDRRQRRRRLSTVAVACLALLVAGSAWQFRVRSDVSAEPVTNAFVVLPERRALPDGSIVELRPGAEIAVAFTTPLRQISLIKGEAHFQVAKDPSRPFVVDSGGIQVRAVGTAFTVQRGAAETEVVVTEGRVAVDRFSVATDIPSPGLGASTRTIALLDAGNRIVVTDTNPQTSVPTSLSAPEIDQHLAWRAPRLEFTGTSLADAVALLNKHTDPAKGVYFKIADESLAAIEVSGLFRADNAEAFIGLLEGGFGIRAERRSEREIVLHKAR